jgi:DsbC/DsbD-like thiol-disulfide interchange protein
MMTGIEETRATARSRAPHFAAAGFCALGLLGVLGANAATAGDASPWNGDARSAVRLVAGGPAHPDAPIHAGIEMRLQPGWHTYWRYPGDAGVPPHFDFSGSQNVAGVTVLWPAPHKITEQGMTAIGYVGDMVWPLAIVPQDRGKPVTLRLKLDYAVCEKLCVPAEGKAELALTGGPMPANAALAHAQAQVPKKSVMGDSTPLAIRAIRRESGAARPRILVDVAAPAGGEVALFVEGPSPDWALPVPMAVGGAPAGLQRFAFDLDGAPPGAKYEGAHITLTAVAGDNAIEVTTHLD